MWSLRCWKQGNSESRGGPDVRWVGNEKGYAVETNWCTLNRKDFAPGVVPDLKFLQQGQEDGTHWVPAEVDVSIRPGWYYHPEEDNQVKTLETLLDIYYSSIGIKKPTGLPLTDKHPVP